jgi:hypothetical protein
MSQDNQNVRVIGPIEIAGKNGIPINMIPSRAEVITIASAIIYTMPVLLFIGTTGDVAVIPWDQADTATYRVFKTVPDGSFLPIYVKRVGAVGSGTTATNLLACY